MPRPTKPRWVERPPTADFYAPHGVPLHRLEGVVLPVDGFEALRLADAERFDHETAAALMGVSRPTFSRILTDARAIVATALANGWALRIAGGDFQVADDRPEPPDSGRRGRRCGHGRGHRHEHDHGPFHGHGRGRGGGRSGRRRDVPDNQGEEDAES